MNCKKNLREKSLDMCKFLALKQCLFLCTSFLASDRPFPLTKSNVLRLSCNSVKKSLFTWLLTFRLLTFVQTFLQNRVFFFPHHLNFFLSYTLPILRFGAQMYLNLSAS